MNATPQTFAESIAARMAAVVKRMQAVRESK